MPNSCLTRLGRGASPARAAAVRSLYSLSLRAVVTIVSNTFCFARRCTIKLFNSYPTLERSHSKHHNAFSYPATLSRCLFLRKDFTVHHSVSSIVGTYWFRLSLER